MSPSLNPWSLTLSISCCRWGQRCLSLLMLLPCALPHLGLNPGPFRSSAHAPPAPRTGPLPGRSPSQSPNPCGDAHLFDSKRKKTQTAGGGPPGPPGSTHTTKAAHAHATLLRCVVDPHPTGILPPSPPWPCEFPTPHVGPDLPDEFPLPGPPACPPSRPNLMYVSILFCKAERKPCVIV